MKRIGDWTWDDKSLDYIGSPYGPGDSAYFILKDQLFIKRERSWVEHLRDKVWFNKKVEDDFCEIWDFIEGTWE